MLDPVFMLKLMDKEISTTLAQNFRLSEPMKHISQTISKIRLLKDMIRTSSVGLTMVSYIVLA